jgi:hypothetical protein
MEHLLENDEKFNAERDYNSLKVQKRIKDPLFLFPSIICCSIYSARNLMQKEIAIHWHLFIRRNTRVL